MKKTELFDKACGVYNKADFINFLYVLDVLAEDADTDADGWESMSVPDYLKGGYGSREMKIFKATSEWYTLRSF